MDEFLKKWGITRDDFNTIVAMLSLLAALVALPIFPPIRRFLANNFYETLNFLGFTGWVYRRRFLNRYSKVHNIYLDRMETLDLRATYIPLHINRPDRVGRTPAVHLLADTAERRLIIVGDPGTGKTTLIKAFATGILKPFSGLRAHELHLIRRVRETPVIVDLRQFGSAMYQQLSLFQFITDHVLRDEMRIKRAEAFLLGLLRSERCLILLDGLDEVSDEEYDRVRSRVAEFCAGSAAHPETEKSRVILTCRKQNFERMRTDWVPVPFREVVTLVPFDMDEVFEFLQRRASEFREGRTPTKFFEQIKISGVADMHRTPLILTISLGLYLNTPKYEIPGSIAKFYEEMIGELLRRHDFRAQHQIQSVNLFNSEDKSRFLREFALKMAIRDKSFDEFSYQEIRDFFHEIHKKMKNLSQDESDAFIDEIIDRSGLLTRVSVDDIYIFAHRSIHEYFIAKQLARNPVDGADSLIQRANDLRWRHVIVFFCSLDHEQVEPFLERLIDVNLELAGHCLSGAQMASHALAERIVSDLVRDVHQGDVSVSLPALVAMTHSQHNHVRDRALVRLQSVLGDVLQPESHQLMGLRDEDMLELLRQLTVANSIQVVPTCLQLSKLIADPKDSIEPLWHCLTIPEIQRHNDICRRVVQQLLDSIMTPEGVAELQRQPAFSPGFITDEIRSNAYPFKNGYEPRSNIVTLLAWADHVNAFPTAINKFFLAKTQFPAAWRTVERDRSRFALKIHWFPIGLALSVASHSLPFIYLILVFGVYGWDAFFVSGESKWWILLYGGIGLIASLIFIVLTAIYDLVYPPKAAFSGSVTRDTSAYIADWLDETFGESVKRLTIVIVVAGPILISLSIHCMLINYPFLLRTLVQGVFIPIVILAPSSRIFKKGNITYLRQPNPVIAIYDDLRSRHWVEPIA